MTHSMSCRSRRPRAFAAPIAALGVLLALVLAGCGGGQGGATAEKPVPPPSDLGAPDGKVAITVDGEGFHPNLISAAAGRPITLAVTRTTNETCGTQIVFRSLGIQRDLPLDQTVEITLTPTEKGEIAFACGMDMLKGSIVVQ